MRSALPTNDLTQPYVAVVCFDKNNVPQFAFTSFGVDANDMTEVHIMGAYIPIVTNIDDLQITENMPASMGSGLVRKEATFTIRNDGPFAKSPFLDTLYSAGASANSFYFGIWATDYSKTLLDIFQTGASFGYYRIDMGMDWSEESLSTSLKLLELPMTMFGRLSTQLEAAENLLNGSEWQRLIEAPAYLGYNGKVAATGRVDAGISGYDSYNKSVLGVIAGVVQSATLSGTSLVLGKSPTLASYVGATVKLKFANGCVVAGVITDLGSGDYGIDTAGMTMNAAWDTVTVKSVGTLAAGTPVDTTIDLNKVILDSDLTRIPSPTMFMRSSAPVTFYAAGVQTSATALYVKLSGISDEATKTLNHEDFKDPANLTWPRRGINTLFNATQQSTNFPTDDAQMNYASWEAPASYTLHFSNKTFVLADIQRSGIGWELIVTPHVNSGVTLTNIYYVRMIENTTLMEDAAGVHAIFYSKGDSLVTVPTSDIVSIAYANADFGIPNLCKITLKKRPSDVDESYDNNFVYVDTWPPMYGAEVISYLVQTGGMPAFMLGETLTGDLRGGNTLSLAVTTETWADLLDTVCFEAGLLLKCDAGLYQLRPSVAVSRINTFNRGVSTQTYQRISCDADIQFGEVIDGTYQLSMGRSLTNIDNTGAEFVRANFTYSYKYSSHGGDKLRELRSNKAAKDNDRIINYRFKHICDTLTVRAAALQMSRIGHPASIGETTRVVTFGLPLRYAYLQALDVVALRDFRHVSALGAPLTEYDEDSAVNPVYTLGPQGVYGRYTQATPFMCLPGVGVIATITYNFSGSGVPITVSFKQTQPDITSNLRDVADNINVNTDVINAAEGATAPETAAPTTSAAAYMCPGGTVVITPGGSTASNSVVNDPCCNSSSSDADAYSDPTIVEVCSGGAQASWPKYPYCAMYLWADIGDNEFASTAEKLFPVMQNAFGPYSWAVLKSITYTGIGDILPTCVKYYPTANPTNIHGVLHVDACLFSAPAGEYAKTVYLEFDVYTCTTMNNTDWLNGDIYYAIQHMEVIHTTQVVQVPVKLREVSDIDIS